MIQLNWLDIDLLLQDRLKFLVKQDLPENEYNMRFDEILWILVKLRQKANIEEIFNEDNC